MYTKGSSNEKNFIKIYKETEIKHEESKFTLAEGSLTTLPDLTIEPIKVLFEKMAHLLN
jgi:hypothetical protein